MDSGLIIGLIGSESVSGIDTGIGSGFGPGICSVRATTRAGWCWVIQCCCWAVLWKDMEIERVRQRGMKHREFGKIKRIKYIYGSARPFLSGSEC